MLAPLPHELRAVENLLSQVRAHAGFYSPTVLLRGLPGVGKRTVAQDVAMRLALDFVEVPCSLLGSNRLVELDMLSAGSRPRMYYLSSVGEADLLGKNVLVQAARTRTVAGPGGSAWFLDRNDWLVASTTGGEGRHSVPRVFDVVVDVTWPSSEELEGTCGALGAMLVPPVSLSSEARDLFRLPPVDGLRSMRRWLAVAASESAEIDARGLLRAMNADVVRLCNGLLYQGQALTAIRFEEWAAQFPAELRTAALRLLECLAHDYFFGIERFDKALLKSIQDVRIPAGQSVALCTWQRAGKSAGYVSYALRKLARWNLSDAEIDLRNPDVWPPASAVPHEIVVADDFVGTGELLGGLPLRPGRPINLLLERHPHSRIRVLVAVAFESAMTDVMRMWPASDRISFHCGTYLGERDRCFSSESQIFPDRAVRSELEDFCWSIDYEDLVSDKTGYGGLAALVAFPHSVPDNTLPPIWVDDKHWLALLPAVH